MYMFMYINMGIYMFMCINMGIYMFMYINIGIYMFMYIQYEVPAVFEVYTVCIGEYIHLQL